MKSILVYDPPMCCSTGICGAEVDQMLVTFAADLDWLKGEGVAVKRINLSQEPAEFAANEIVSAILQNGGVDGLPVILRDGAQLCAGRYPGRAELAQMAGVAYAPEASETADAAAKPAASGCCGAGSDSEGQPSGCC